ncbi:MAG TPA: hypothetical protein VFH44_06615 [Solirubrobacterales bacterium]|nr:hypothetical protein [Solirubrobacterales bacterium]
MAASALTAVSNGEVIIIVVLVVAPIAAIAFAGAGAVYRQIGRGTFAMDHEQRAGGGELGPAMAQAAHEAEIRQMLEAKAFRQRERGEDPIDIDAELERLTAPPAVVVGADPALVAEIRELVVARNARRARQGKDPLDVDAEVARQLRDLENLGQ